MNRLDEIEARANAATEGPWVTYTVIPQMGSEVLTAPREGEDYGDYVVPEYIDMDNAEFIAHSRTDVPALVSVARYALSQHAPDGHGNCGPCDDATGEDGWPCSTVREIHRLLGEDA